MISVRKLFDDFLKSKNRPLVSRKLLPFLSSEGPQRDFLLEKFAANPGLIFDLDFTPEEIYLLEPAKYGAIFIGGVETGQLDLAYTIGRASGKYNICCEFEIGTLPERILSVLNANIEDNDIATCYIKKADLKEMLFYGLMPCPCMVQVASISNSTNYIKILEYYQKGLSEEEIEYWTGRQDSYDYLGEVGFWSLITKSYAENSAQIGQSYPMLFFFRDLLWSSMRPKTNMAIFETAVSNTYEKESEIPDQRIAVARYVIGMSKGLFHGERPKDICGYFYYNELESTTFLSYSSAFTAFNKTDALLKLLEQSKDKNIEIKRLLYARRANRTISLNNLEKHMNGTFPADMMFSMQMAQALLGYKQSRFENESKVYLGKELSLYAYEDALDQPLCSLARKEGYDVVILTNMIGSHQVVTEVLDTRESSMKMLWFKR